MFQKTTRRIGWAFAAAALLATAPAAWSQEKPKAAAEVKPGAPLAISRLVVGTGVEDREPVGVAEKFPAATEKIYAFLEAANIPRDLEITLVWSRGDQEVGSYNLPLKQGPKWRTWAYKNLRGIKGEWKVQVRDAGGNSLKEVRFKVE